MRKMLRILVPATLLAVAIWPTAPLAHAATCPTSISFEPTADGTFDAGWTGIDHAIPIAGVALDLAIDCAASDPPCGTCPIVGTVADPSRPRRCRNDSSRTCTVATEVADCGAAATCATFLSPPQSIGIGGLPLCYTTELAGPITGSVDVETGAFAPRVPIVTEVRWGVYGPAFGGGLIQGCARCVGDPVPNDGARGGTCDAGPRIGLTCDAHTISGFPDFGSTSFDCPTETTTIINFAVGAIPASTDSLTMTIGPASPPCTGVSGPCFCATCNNAATEACASNADCPPSGGNPGVCNGRRCLSGTNNGAPCTNASECPGGLCGRPGEPTKPNACLDDSAAPNGPYDECGPDGRCIRGPVNNYCANHPDRGCTTDAACDDVPGACVSEYRRCLPENPGLGGTVTAAGTSTPPVNGVAEPTDLAALTCLPPSGSSVLNNIGGFPGLVRSHQPGRLLFGDATPAATNTPIPTPTATPTAACPPVPVACRTPIVSGRASVLIDDRPDDRKDQLQFKWSRGAATTLAELGNPLSTDAYDLCVYDAGGLRAGHAVPAGGTCRGKPCWKARPNGYVYRDRDGVVQGITRVDLKSGLDGKAQAVVKGKGEALPLPAPVSLVSPLTVQLRNRMNGTCLGATFTAPFDVATDAKLKDRAD